MGRRPCCTKIGLNRGAWSAREDRILSNYIHVHGQGKWRQLPLRAGLKRCGKSCRLRWMNYLRPDIKRGNISLQEEDLIIRLHSLLGNRWSLIAGRLPGRTDNEIKNYWNTNLRKRLYSNHPLSVEEDDSPTAIRTKPLRRTIHLSAAAAAAAAAATPAVPEVDNAAATASPFFCNNDGCDGDGDDDGEMDFLMPINGEEYLDIDISDILLSEGGDFLEQTDSAAADGGDGRRFFEDAAAMESWGEGELQCLSSFMSSETNWMD